MKYKSRFVIKFHFLLFFFYGLLLFFIKKERKTEPIFRKEVIDWFRESFFSFLLLTVNGSGLNKKEIEKEKSEVHMIAHNKGKGKERSNFAFFFIISYSPDPIIF